MSSSNKRLKAEWCASHGYRALLSSLCCKGISSFRWLSSAALPSASVMSLDNTPASALPATTRKNAIFQSINVKHLNFTAMNGIKKMMIHKAFLALDTIERLDGEWTKEELMERFSYFFDFKRNHQDEFWEIYDENNIE